MATARHSVRGFALIQGMVLMAVLAILVVILQGVFKKGIQSETANAAKAELNDLFDEISVVLRRPETCAAALGNPAFPGPSTSIPTISYPKVDPSQAPDTVLIRKGVLTDTSRLAIKDISISIPPGATQIGSNGSQAGYLGDFEVDGVIPIIGSRAVNPNQSLDQTLLQSQVLVRKLPIYLINSGGTLSGCMITTFSQGQTTIEDYGCQKVTPPTGAPFTRYDPVNKKCV